MPAFSILMTPHYLTTMLHGLTERSTTPQQAFLMIIDFQSHNDAFTLVEATSSVDDFSSVYFRRKTSPRMRYYALTLWWMLPILQIRRQ